MINSIFNIISERILTFRFSFFGTNQISLISNPRLSRYHLHWPPCVSRRVPSTGTSKVAAPSLQFFVKTTTTTTTTTTTPTPPPPTTTTPPPTTTTTTMHNYLEDNGSDIKRESWSNLCSTWAITSKYPETIACHDDHADDEDDDHDDDEDDDHDDGDDDDHDDDDDSDDDFQPAIVSKFDSTARAEKLSTETKF